MDLLISGILNNNNNISHTPDTTHAQEPRASVHKRVTHDVATLFLYASKQAIAVLMGNIRGDLLVQPKEFFLLLHRNVFRNFWIYTTKTSVNFQYTPIIYCDKF